MSLILSNSGDIHCSARSGGSTRGFTEDKVFIGDEEIDIKDFCILVEYIFTNTDLEDDDPRIVTANHIKNYAIAEGYNSGNKRFVDKEYL
jgi:hypothetical protein